MGTYIVIKDIVGIHASEAHEAVNGETDPAIIADQAHEIAESMCVEDGEGLRVRDLYRQRCLRRAPLCHGEVAWNPHNERSVYGAIVTEAYIPNARDAVIAYFGRNADGNLRCHCVRCNDTSPLTDARKVYGDTNIPEPLTYGRGSYGNWDTCDQCEMCWTSLLALSQSCQREHDEQQARFARGPITHVIEMGMVSDIRCRIY